jgi:mRNA-degrading endonuclease RelE of RelBE toxin-antitoxin system
MEYLEFIETPVFSKQRSELLDDDSYQKFQAYLLKNHEDGDTISKTGGCKKIRWGLEGKGKRGGVRVIYYCLTEQGKIYLLLVYSKNRKDDLSEQEKKVLNQISQMLNRPL